MSRSIRPQTLTELCQILWLISPLPSSGFSYRNSVTKRKGENTGFFLLTSKAPPFMSNQFLKQEFLLSCMFQASGSFVPARLSPDSSPPPPWASPNFLPWLLFFQELVAISPEGCISSLHPSYQTQK